MDAQHFITILSSGWPPLLIFSVWMFLNTVQERFHEAFEKPKMMWRLLPFLPMVICLPCAFIAGPWVPEETSNIERVLLGVLMGIAAYNFGGIANRFGLDKLFIFLGVKTKELVVKKKDNEQPDAVE